MIERIQGVFVVNWPTPQEYNEAIQNPKTCFADPDLLQGKIAVNALGLPRVSSGNFASVYKVECGANNFAVRCFLSNRNSQEKRYQAISDFVRFDSLECTIDFYYLDKGIKVGGIWYPLVKMPWIEGELLDQFIAKNIAQPAKILELARQFYRMVRELEDNEVAHGDLQHGNVIVTAGGLRLVDYDALYVPALAGFNSLEMGHLNYQHPHREEKHFDPTVDNFSTWLIYISLMCLAIDPSIYSQFECGDECIIFKRKDLIMPEKSVVFKTLLAHESPEIRSLIKLLGRLLWMEPHMVPPLNLPEAETLNIEAVETIVAGAKPAERPEPVEASSTYLDDLDSDIIDTLTQTSTVKYRPNRQNQRAKAVNAFVLKARRRMEKIVADASFGLSPRRWLRMNLQEADNFCRQGDYESAIKIYQDIYAHQMPMTADEQLNLVIKRGRCHFLMNQPDMARNFFISARSIELPETGTRIDKIVEYKRSFFVALSARKAEDKQEALSILTQLLVFHDTNYSDPNHSSFPLDLVLHDGTNYCFNPEEQRRIHQYADELNGILDFIEAAREIVLQTNPDSSQWHSHLNRIAELAWAWQAGVFHLPSNSMVARECAGRLYEYAGFVLTHALPGDSLYALIFAMAQALRSEHHLAELVNCLKCCNSKQLEEAATKLSARVSWSELICLLAEALAEMGPSEAMTALSQPFFQLVLKKLCKNNIDVALEWLCKFDELLASACLNEQVQHQIFKRAHRMFVNKESGFPMFLNEISRLGENGNAILSSILNNVIDHMLEHQSRYSFAEVQTVRNLASNYRVPLKDWDAFNQWYLRLAGED